MVLVGILSGRSLKRKAGYTGGEAQYVNVQGSVHWKGVYKVRV